MEDRSLFLVDERIKTFNSWPFSDSEKCNVKNMAEAGFYSISIGSNDADAAKCFLCGKEMDGWEACDDPWAEHKSHAPKCAFVQLGKNEDDLLLLEYLSVIKQYMINDAKHNHEVAKEKWQERAKTVKRKCLNKK